VANCSARPSCAAYRAERAPMWALSVVEAPYERPQRRPCQVPPYERTFWRRWCLNQVTTGVVVHA
jgi:hypothetical protein